MVNRIYSVYRLTHLPDGKIYIGVTGMPLVLRFAYHIVQAKLHPTSPLCKVLLQYDQFEVFKYFDVDVIASYKIKSKAYEAERELIREYNSELNIRGHSKQVIDKPKGKRGRKRGFKHTEEQKRKMSIARKAAWDKLHKEALEKSKHIGS